MSPFETTPQEVISYLEQGNTDLNNKAISILLRDLVNRLESTEKKLEKITDELRYKDIIVG